MSKLTCMPEQEVTFQDNKLGWKKLNFGQSKEDILTQVSKMVLRQIFGQYCVAIHPISGGITQNDRSSGKSENVIMIIKIN